MCESEKAKASDLECLKALVQKLYEIEAKQFQSVSEMLNVLIEELGLDDVRTVTIDSTDDKLTMEVKTQKVIKTTWLEIELTLQSSESQTNESKEDSPKRMYRIDKIRCTKNTVPWCSLIQNWVLPIAILVFLLIMTTSIRNHIMKRLLTTNFIPMIIHPLLQTFLNKVV